MLASLILLAVVGATLAFKAHPFASERIFCQSTNGECTIPVTSITTEEIGQPERSNPCKTLGAKDSTYGMSATYLPCSLTTTRFFTTLD